MSLSRFSGTWAASSAALSGLLYAFAQPDRGAWPIAFVCLIPLLQALRGRGARARLGLGWLSGTVAALALVLEPTGVAVARYFEIAPWQGRAAAFGLGQLFGALPFALFAWMLGDPARQAVLARVGRAAAALVLAEAVRSSFFTGLPWGLLAYAVTPAPLLAQSAAFGGAPLVSALLAGANAALASLLDRSHRRIAAAVACATFALLLLPAARGLDGEPGLQRADAAPPRPGAVRIRLVQGSLPEVWRRDATRIDEAIDRLVGLSRGVDTHVVAWPESALSAPLPTNTALLRRRLAAMESPRPSFVIGAPRVGDGDAVRLHNSAVVIGPELEIRDHHDKTRLVPFSEYVPTPLRWLGVEGWSEAPGTRLRPLDVAGHRLGVSICYELIFSAVSRDLVRGGAELLLNLSNDEWFGTQRGMEQHFAAAVLRAIETDRPLVRATNTGITAGIDRLGRIVARLPEGTPAALSLDADPRGTRTAFVRFGDWVPWVSAGLLAALLVREPRGQADARQS
jgi:apolipoprotein N-acyltransferase